MPAAPTFEIAPPAPWVVPISATAADRQEPDAGGISYLLFDRQESVAPRAFYRHEVRKITSEAGVQNGAAISITFDPAYEKLTIHAISSTRDGVVTNRLDRGKIELLRREPELESFLYDGAYTAQCELEDVRVGDVIEFAYTTAGANPVKKDKFSSIFGTDWPFPVQRAVARVIAPAERKLQFRTLNGAAEPRITSSAGFTEYLSDAVNVAARRIDPDTPTDYDPRGSIEYTEYGDWAELAAWAMSVFETKGPDSDELKLEVARLQAISDPEERVVAALRFVQDDIRYLGVESGAGSHQPSAPGEVLRRRFGDCKDKVVLLATLLKRTGIDAAPALVSSRLHGGVTKHLPRPEVFDHVILHVRVADATHWLDPTRSGQRGPLSQVYVSDFGSALVLRPGADELTPMAPPRGSLPRKEITNRYRIPAPGGIADLQIVSQYHGLAAERTRSSFRSKGAESVQKDYLQYYARRFPAIRIKQPVVYEELPGENGCRVIESYEVPEIWQLAEDGSKYELFLSPAELDSEMGSPGSSQRQDPLALNHPVRVVEQIEAEMFEPWPMNLKKQEIVNAFFRFREEPASERNRVRVNQSYESLADRVPVAELAKYNSALSRARESLSYTLNYQTPEQIATMRSSGRFNWPIAALLACAVAAAVFLSWRFYQTSKLPEPLPIASTRYEGLGGWLILVALGLIRSPIGLGQSLVELYPSVFNVETWRLLTDPGNPAYHALWAPALLFALFFNALYLIGSLLVLVLFFKRRAAWRPAFIVLLLIGLLGVCLDHFLTMQIPAAAAESVGVTDIVTTTISTAIWVPYAFRSERVRSTFRY